ncbi:MAG: hypothetical protein BWK76_21120 [Desulfobulbaceae bacterium A2]|nr:MAG: hypothetical protein BWK76_21120 [Desulfobulbaceae bacterium A2]
MVPVPRVLIIYFSLSSQTRNLVLALGEGLAAQGVAVTRERLQPLRELRFPLGGLVETLAMMLLTFFRRRIPIQPPSPCCREKYDLIVLAGPTWSYNPSGPVLSLLDSFGQEIFAGRTVLPLISCRGYWRLHWWGLRGILRRLGATVPNLLVFSHPSPEPWRTIGVFFKLAGRLPEKMVLLRRHYRKYGHSRHQVEEARRFGEILGSVLQRNAELDSLDFRTALALP